MLILFVTLRLMIAPHLSIAFNILFCMNVFVIVRFTMNGSIFFHLSASRCSFHRMGYLCLCNPICVVGILCSGCASESGEDEDVAADEEEVSILAASSLVVNGSFESKRRRS